ncbi:MAG: hypothetical protein HUU38_08115 [Anaerolineales bacterium]|jgi:hypothetical protein|nr:hypothetical protein [Anaerolineales bacterium]
MYLSKRLFFLLFGLFSLTFSACTNFGAPTPRPTLVLDAVCQKVMDTTFQSTVTYPLGEGEGGVIFGPHLISFKNDGTVYWRYSLTYVEGTFECQNGVITARFSEGEKEAFEGNYIEATALLEVENTYFSKAPSE